MRKTEKWTVPGVRTEKIGQRDNGKTFLITEWPADRFERWAIRGFLAIANAGIEVPDNLKSLGAAGIAALGLRALSKTKADDAEPLLDALMECVEFVSAAGPMPLMSGENAQIEDYTTRVQLKKKVFELHTGFLLPVAGLTSA